MSARADVFEWILLGLREKGWVSQTSTNDLHLCVYNIARTRLPENFKESLQLFKKGEKWYQRPEVILNDCAFYRVFIIFRDFLLLIFL